MNTTTTTSGVTINTDSREALEALRASRPATVRCEQHPSFEADYCPRCAGH
jgi:hypothetical protein